jgi:molybdenum cofactor guanylyltransferase
VLRRLLQAKQSIVACSVHAQIATPATGLQPLLLLGGRSTRMGQPKHLLQLPNGTRLYERQLDLLCTALPDATTIHISLAPDSALDDKLLASSYTQKTEGAITSPPRPRKLQLIYDTETSLSSKSSGPAAGLIAAYAFAPTATWLVLACDYPIMTPTILTELQNAYEPPLTCFHNAAGFNEALVGIWSAAALSRLARNVAVGMSSPSAVVRELHGKSIALAEEDEMALWNVNTPADWEVALQHLRAA